MRPEPAAPCPTADTISATPLAGASVTVAGLVHTAPQARRDSHGMGGAAPTRQREHGRIVGGHAQDPQPSDEGGNVVGTEDRACYLAMAVGSVTPPLRMALARPTRAVTPAAAGSAGGDRGQGGGDRATARGCRCDGDGDCCPAGSDRV